MKRTLLLGFTLIVLMMSWEGQHTSANVLDNGPIPEESIRLRIIANSDSVQDQWLKREVRDALIAQMETWADEIKTFDEAQEVVEANLPVLQEVVDKTIRERGFSYTAVVDFGQVPFPTKLYGSYVYPAGNYEALRVRIGEAKGQNWWCVLFPPLCFIDMSNGDAVATAKASEEQSKEAEGTKESEPVDQTTSIMSKDDSLGELRQWRQARFEQERQPVVEKVEQPESGNSSEEAKPAAQPEVEVRFYLWEKVESWFS
ncbi:stage II sporulation protein R [Brevibacillus reuszeri]|uniref:stage II sporulation protein R n=1 Tax=Brevibacillus reuszeri TaxID=54915 RepID=UPI00289A57FE|nr:stage II sporulation protein R [Brevibacillus reuszeri]